jgi:glycosyltransferase involved in cell wall biosynthesis
MSDPATTKVLHTFARMEPGGAEVRLLELMRRLDPREFCVHVCALSGLSGSLDAEVRALGGAVIPLRLDWRFPLRFLRLLRDGGYGVVHSHVHYASGPLLALAALAGVPVRVAHFHATHDGGPHGGPRTAVDRARQRAMRVLTAWSATAVIACGEGVMRAAWGEDWHRDPRRRVVYDAIDLERFEAPIDADAVRRGIGVPRGARMFIHVGNQLAPKNHRRLVAIFAAIRDASPSAWLVLAGKGTDDPDGVTARAVREFGVQDRVVALGVRGDVPTLLKAADALLLPSLYEGLPGVVLEACAVGVPVLATDLPGVREIAGRLPLVRYLPLSASDADWAAAALALPDAAERMGLREIAAALFRPTEFHVDRAVDAHRALWGAALRARDVTS